jgi:hypothetical protein
MDTESTAPQGENETPVENTENQTAEPVVRDWVQSEKYHNRKVYTAKGVGIVLGEASSAGTAGQNGDPERLLVEVIDTAEHVDVSFKSVRFKAVNDSYRDKYNIDKSVKTESGGYSISNGDELAEALKGHNLTELGVIAKDNGLTEKWAEWERKCLNPGMRRMNLGNMLRTKAKKGEDVLFFGKPVAEHMTIRGIELKEAGDKKAAELAAAKEKREAEQAEKKAAKEAAKAAAATKTEPAAQAETQEKKSKKKAA